MSTASLAWRQFRLERRMFWRNPTAAFFNFLLPLLFLFLIATAFGTDRDDLEVLVPGIAGLAVMTTTFTALAFNVTFLREQGILKRIQGTPMPALSYFGGLIGSAVLNALVQVLLVVVIGHVVYDLPWPRDWLELAVFTVAGVAAFASLGVAFSQAIPNFDAAAAYVNAVFLPLIFISGIFYSTESLPAVLDGDRQRPAAQARDRRAARRDRDRRRAGGQPRRARWRCARGRPPGSSPRCAGSGGSDHELRRRLALDLVGDARQLGLVEAVLEHRGGSRRRAGTPSWKCQSRSTPSVQKPIRSSARSERRLSGLARAVIRCRPRCRKPSESTSAFDSLFAPLPQCSRPSQVPTVARRSRREKSLKPVRPIGRSLSLRTMPSSSRCPLSRSLGQPLDELARLAPRPCTGPRRRSA